METETKLCSKCRVMRTPNDFTKGSPYNCRACVRKYNAAWRKKNHERSLADMRLYQIMNKESLAIRKAEYREKNREIIRQRQAAYVEANRETVNERQRARYDREYASKQRTKRRAAKLGLESDGSGRDQVWKKSQGICHLCYKEWETDDKGWEIDHIIPLQPIEGPPGHDVLENKAVACIRCNRRKRNKLVASGAYSCS